MRLHREEFDRSNMSNHIRFVARTVLVKNGDYEVAYRALDRSLKNERIMEGVRRRRFFEKPFLYRQRVGYEKMKRIYDSEMQRKIEFLMRKNRPEPWIR